MSTVHSGSTLSSDSTSSSASASSRSSSPLPSASSSVLHSRRQSLPRALKLVDGPPVTNRRSLDFASDDQTRRSVDGSARRSTDGPTARRSTVTDGPQPRRSMEYQPHRLRALADLRHLPTIPSPIEMPPPHTYYFTDLQHEQPSSHSHPATSSSLFNQQASSSISNTASSLFMNQPPTTSHSTSTSIHDPGPSTLSHPAATALITPPSTPTPVGRRKPSISYLPPDSPSHHTRRRSSVVYRPVSPSQTSRGLSAQSSGFEPPAKHARRRSMLIHGPHSAVNSGADMQYVEAGTDAQYATDSRPWWSSEVPVSAPVLGSFQDPPIEAPVDGPTRLAATSVAAVDPTIAATSVTTAAIPHLPLHKQHAELLYSIAQEEARCAELRGQLAVREARLAGLKQRWEDRRAERWGDRAAVAEKEVEALDSSKGLDVEGNGRKMEDVDDEEGDGKDRESILEETMRKLEGRKVEIDEGNGDGGGAQAFGGKSDNTPASSSSTSPRSSSTSTTPITDPASPASSSTSSLSSSSSSFGGIREARRWVRSLFVGPKDRPPSPLQPIARQSASAPSSDKPSPPRPKCTAAQTSYAPPQHRVSMPYASGLSAQPATCTASGPSAYESGAPPSGSVAHSKPDVSARSGVPAVALDERAACDANKRASCDANKRASCGSNRHWHRRAPSEMTIFAPEEEWIWAWYFVGR